MFKQVVDKRSTAFRTSLSERLLPEYDDSAGRRRAKFIVRSILECQNTDSYPAEVFLEKPSKKEYKDYYWQSEGKKEAEQCKELMQIWMVFSSYYSLIWKDL